MCHHAQQLRTGSRFRYGGSRRGPSARHQGRHDMARLFPVRSQFQLDTSGARRFAEAQAIAKGAREKQQHPTAIQSS